MKSTNIVASILAILAMIGFLSVFGFLGLQTVPPENKDFFNIALIALIGFVGTAFGYYLGTSDSSAKKNELLAKATPPSAPLPPNPENGRISLGALSVIAGIMIIAMLAIGGCATMQKETPESLTAKSLLSARQGIIAAAQTADSLCSQGIMKQDACDEARKLYRDAQPAYTAAADAFLVYLTAKDPAAKQSLEALQPRLLAIYTDMDGLIKKYGGAK